MFESLSAWDLSLPWFDAICCGVLKTFIIFIFWIYCCFFIFYPTWRIIFEPVRLKFVLRHLKYNSWIKSKIKSLHLSDFSKLFWFLKANWKKKRSSATTSFKLSKVLNSVLLLFKCIRRFSSSFLEEIKLNAIANWAFYVPDFWRPIVTSLNPQVRFNFVKVFF